MQPTSQPARGFNRKPMKRPDKVVLAERKNKREEMRLRMYLNFLSKQGLYEGFLIEKEKRQIKNNITKVQRSSGNSKVGLPPTDPKDTAFEKSEYFKGGAKISEKSLTRWRATEKEIERVLLKEEAEKARAELETADMGWLKELFKDFDMDSSSDEEDDDYSKHPNGYNYVSLPDPADVFESLRPEVPPPNNIYKLKSENDFTVSKWQRCIVNNYVSMVAKPPEKITRRMRRPLSEIARRRDDGQERVSLAIRPHSATGVTRKIGGSPSSDETIRPIDVTDGPLNNGCDSAGDPSSPNTSAVPHILSTAKNKLNREKITCTLIDIKDTEKLPNGKPPLGRNDLFNKPHVAHSNGTEQTNNDNDTNNSNSSLRPNTPAKREQRVTFAKKDTVLNEQPVKPASPQNGVVKPIVKRRPQSAGARITTKADGSNVTVSGFITAPILKRQDSRSQITDSKEAVTNPETATKPETPPATEKTEERSPASTPDEQCKSLNERFNEDEKTSNKFKEAPDHPILNRTLSRSFSKSALIFDDDTPSTSSGTPVPETPPEHLGDDRPRMSQWRRQLRADAPPGLSGSKGDIKTYVTISRSERRRQLREMVENNYLDLQKMITQEKDRRLHSRLALFVTLLEFHQKRKDDKKKAKEEKRNEQNEMMFRNRRRTVNPVYNVLSSKR